MLRMNVRTYLKKPLGAILRYLIKFVGRQNFLDGFFNVLNDISDFFIHTTNLYIFQTFLKTKNILSLLGV